MQPICRAKVRGVETQAGAGGRRDGGCPGNRDIGGTPLRPLIVYAMIAGLIMPHSAIADPVGGNVVSGAATITQSGAVTDVTQSTGKAIINWQGFSVAPQETVNFHQPDASSVTLNRVVGNESSIIQGALNANGQIFLINSNGILFSDAARVNVGGLVASTLDISNEDFLAGNYSFSGSSTASVINKGKISATQGGYVSLLGNTVSNQGFITATLGTVAMASGKKTTLNFGGNSLVDVIIDQGVLNALVENKQLIRADGGRVVLTARAADTILSAQVNNTGIVQARSMAALTGAGYAKGSIKLDAHGGKATVSGKLDASAPNGGDGGFIETSGDKVTIADGVIITTKAANGAAGHWLIDPDGFTVGFGGDISGATLSQQLASNNVTIQSTEGSGNDGNIFVNDAVSWAANTLALEATNSIYVNNMMTATGAAGFVATYGNGTNADGSAHGLYMALGETGTFAGKLNFSGTGGISLGGTTYTVIDDISGLQGMTSNANNKGNYVLGTDIDLSSVEDWETLGTLVSFNVNGLGHLITNLKSTHGGLLGTVATGSISNLGVTNAQITQTTTAADVGILAAANTSRLAAVNISNVFTTGQIDTRTTKSAGAIGGIIGNAAGTIFNSYSTASIIGGGKVASASASPTWLVGGVAGKTVGDILNSWSSGDILYRDVNAAGGLVGQSDGNIRNSYSTSNIRNFDDAVVVGQNAGIGGLVGYANYQSSGANKVIENSYATGNVAYTAGIKATNVGGFVGYSNNKTTIIGSYATGNVESRNSTTTASYTGGFAGQAAGPVSNAYASGNVIGGTYAGGFAGRSNQQVSSAYATGDVTAVVSLPAGSNVTVIAGGFSGYSAGAIDNAYSTGNVTSIGVNEGDGRISVLAGGFVGNHAGGAITNAYATGDVSATAEGGLTTASNYVRAAAGGFVGSNTGAASAVTNAYATGKVSASSSTSTAEGGTESYASAGGFVGSFASGPITTIYATGAATATTGSANIVASQNALKGDGAGTLDASATTTPWSVLPNIDVWTTSGVNPTLSVFRDGVIWGTSNNGRPILMSIPVTIGTLVTTYGENISFSDFAIHGLQWGDMASDVLRYDASGHLSYYGRLNAGVYDASALLSSSQYSRLNGIVIVRPKEITLSGVSAGDKDYDGTAAAVLTAAGSIADGVIAGESLNIAGTAAYFVDKNAGDDKSVHLNYGFTDGSGSATGNYAVATTATASINKKTVSATFDVNDKTYDGTATANASGYSVNGMMAGDDLIISYANMSFGDKNAEVGKTVSIDGVSITGGVDAGNYLLASDQIQTTATINPLVLSLVGAKPSDGSVRIDAADIIASNVLEGDTVNLSGYATMTGSAEGTQSFTDLSTLARDNLNYTLAGSTGQIVVGDVNQVVSRIIDGTVDVATTENVLTITQSTDKAIIEWLKFSISADETVKFIQPTSASVVLNRVTGNERSIIDGTLVANGKVFIVNSNGVLFGAGASVNAAALVASTLNISNNNFLNSHYLFASVDGSGAIVNNGNVAVGADGFIALLSENGVTNSGRLDAGEGAALLASAETVSLALDEPAGNTLSGYAIANLSGAVAAGGSITAKLIELAGDAITVSATLDTATNGTLSLTRDAFTIGGSSDFGASFVNGQLAARSLALHALDGDIVVDAPVSYSANTLTLDAAKNIFVNTVVSVSGTGGFTGIYGGADNDYHGGNDANGHPMIGKLGWWNSEYSGINSDGSPMGLYTQQGPTDSGTFAGKVNFSGNGALRLGTRDSVATYTVINDVAGLLAIGGSDYTRSYALGSDIDLSGIADWQPLSLYSTFNGLGHVVNNLRSTSGGLFADIASTQMLRVTNTPLPDGSPLFKWVWQPTLSNVGVTAAAINVVTATSDTIGALARNSNAIIANTFATGTISATAQSDVALNVGGLLGANTDLGSIFNSSTVMDITVAGGAGSQRVGGFVGFNSGLIQGSHSTGTITAYGGYFIGGFAGQNQFGGNLAAGGRLINDYADVDIVLHGGGIVGGFVGSNMGLAFISNSYALGDISGQTNTDVSGLNYGASVGGFAGMNTEFSIIDSSYAAGNIDVTGVNGEPAGSYVGGFVGWQGDYLAGVDLSQITNSYATGNVSSTGDYVGGFAGRNDTNTVISNSRSTGNVVGRNYVGGFIGVNGSAILPDLLKTGSVPGVGYFETIEQHIAFHNSNFYRGSTVPAVHGATISNSSSSGSVTATGSNAVVGQFAGANDYGGQIANSSAIGNGTGTPLVGSNGAHDSEPWVQSIPGLSGGSTTSGSGVVLSPMALRTLEAVKAASVVATTGVQKTQESTASVAANKGGTAAGYSAKPSRIEDDVDLSAAPAAVTQLPDEDKRRRRKAKRGLKASGADYGAAIKSIDVDGKRFDLEKDPSSPGAGGQGAPAPAAP